MAGENTNAFLNSFVVELKDVDRDFVRLQNGTAADLAKLHALARVSLRLKAGEFVFLTGPSGAGKTTLIRLLLGLDNPSAGEVYTLGQPVHKMNESKRRELRRQVGIVFQDHRLLNSLNVFENVELPLHFLGLNRRERERRVMEILEVVQMRDHAQASPRTLSAGEKQRIAIARALVTCPSLVIADEPTGNLDPVTARSLIRLLRELKGHGTTVLIATHDMSLVRDFGGRVLELVSGTLPVNEPNKHSKAYKVPRFWTNASGGVNS
ncbi:MAG: ABC transporter ATP-binding protein [Bdellovibrionales bacterium]|nr:ABC transporter ATP-binding protein [Bdellovibrionales bacterium]